MHGDFITFSIFIIISSITPGPNNLMLLHGGLQRGIVACKSHILGISAGGVVLAMFSYWGLAELINQQPMILTVIKVVGSVYLLWLAWGMWTSGLVPNDDKLNHAKKQSKWQLPLNFWQAAAFQWVNPKAWIMAGMLPSVLLIFGDSPVIDNAPVYLLLFVLNIFCITFWAAGGNSLRALLHRKVLMHRLNIGIVAATLYCAASMWV